MEGVTGGELRDEIIKSYGIYDGEAVTIVGALARFKPEIIDRKPTIIKHRPSHYRKFLDVPLTHLIERGVLEEVVEEPTDREYSKIFFVLTETGVELIESLQVMARL